MQLIKQGFAAIISAPSGTGKSTLIDMVLKSHNNFSLSVSATTRQRREGEVNGVNYYFKTVEEFNYLINQNAFLEYANVYGNLYGTLKSDVEEKNGFGRNIILDIDPIGAQNITKQMGIKVISIFILPPSIEHLRERLVQRGTDSEETINFRISKAREQINYWSMYDYIIVNNNLNVAFLELQTILLGHTHSKNNIIDFR